MIKKRAKFFYFWMLKTKMKEKIENKKRKLNECLFILHVRVTRLTYVYTCCVAIMLV